MRGKILKVLTESRKMSNLSSAEFWDHRQMCDLHDGPAELKDEYDCREVSQFPPVGKHIAQWADGEYQWECEEDQQRSDNVPDAFGADPVCHRSDDWCCYRVADLSQHH